MPTADRAIQSERITFLATPAMKDQLVERAAANGVSVAEFVRRRVLEDELDEANALDALTPEQERELAMLVEQVNEAVPRINAALDAMHETLRTAHEEMQSFFRERGIE